MMLRKQQQKQRVVQFSEDHDIAMVDTVEEAEKSAVWYSKTDLANLRGESATMATGTDEATSTTKELRGRQKKEFISSLLMQQQEHKKLGFSDPKGLFQFSRACTKKSRAQARQQAREHEKEVQGFANDPREMIVSVVEDVLRLVDQC